MQRKIKHEVEACIEKLRKGDLTEGDLSRIAELADDAKPERQELLYLQAEQTRVTTPVMGMSIFENGKFSDGPRDPDDWPYQTVSQAMQDGWRIIKFPEMALLVDDKRTYGLGCEFILERWR